jgi:hypothetical protein
MPSPDCHDDPTNQHGTGFLSRRHGCQLGIEGLVLGSRYRSGRSPDWLKFKNPEAPAVKGIRSDRRKMFIRRASDHCTLESTRFRPDLAPSAAR